MNTGLIAEVEQVCRERGFRLTPLRADVLQLVAESARPVRAYEVLERIRESKAITAPPTVYRSLDFLLDNGFIHKLESINAFAACQSPRRPHIGTFLICDRCQATTEVIDELLQHLLNIKSRAMGFALDARSQTLEVHGSCEGCGSGVDGARARTDDGPDLS